MDQCPDEQTLLDFLGGRLDGPSTARIRAHVSRCHVCNAIATELIRGAASQVVRSAESAKHYELTADAVIAEKYRLVRQIGEGGMGAVWEAECAGHHASGVAIKLLKAFDAKAKKRFLREIAITSRLKHPGLVRVVEVIEDVEAGVPALVMELLDGVSLATRLKDEGRMTVDEAFAIARELARTLSAVHAAGLVHRDIKPANVQLAGNGRVVLLDLGLALDREADDATILTRTGQAVGTPAYMAPERLAGEEAIDEVRADLWSLGVVLYECITGAKPFGGRTVAEVLRSAVRGPPPHIEQEEVAVLLQPNPADRPATAEEALELLDRSARDR